jgi:hypothetical protein
MLRDRRDNLAAAAVSVSSRSRASHAPALREPRGRGSNGSSGSAAPEWSGESSRRLVEVTSGSASGLHAPEWPRVFEACLRRIARWRTPPNWSAGEWAHEVRAQAYLAKCLAEAEYDASRGVPFDAFVHQRVLAGVLTRYRQEWAFAVHCSGVGSFADVVETPIDSSHTHTVDEIVDYVRIILPRADRALLLALYWQNRTEATIGRALGISQQAVSKRKRTLLRELRCQLA